MEVLYNTFTKFGIPMTLVVSLKCDSVEFSAVQVGEHLSYMFPIQNGLKQGDASVRLLFMLPSDMPLGRSN